MMAEVGVTADKSAADKAEEKKEQTAATGDANAKNKKKKAKKAAAKAAEEKKEVAPKEIKELTDEEHRAAIKAAMEKRGNVQQKVDNSKSSIAAGIKAEKDKRVGKKAKNHGNEATTHL